MRGRPLSLQQMKHDLTGPDMNDMQPHTASAPNDHARSLVLRTIFLFPDHFPPRPSTSVDPHHHHHHHRHQHRHPHHRHHHHK